MFVRAARKKFLLLPKKLEYSLSKQFVSHYAKIDAKDELDKIKMIISQVRPAQPE